MNSLDWWPVSSYAFWIILLVAWIHHRFIRKESPEEKEARKKADRISKAAFRTDVRREKYRQKVRRKARGFQWP